MHIDVLGSFLAGDLQNIRGRIAAGPDDRPLESEFAQLLDQQACGLRRGAVELECVDVLRQHAGQQRHEVHALPLEELLGHELGADRLIGGFVGAADLLAGLVVREQAADALYAELLHHPFDSADRKTRPWGSRGGSCI